MSASKPSSAPSDPAAMKTRIITHMNADHQDSLTRYLEHFCALPSHLARHAHLTDLSLAWLLLSSSSSPSPRPHHSKSESATTHFIPLDPPMSSFSESRQRLAEMDKECREKLGRSDVTLKVYVPPKGAGMVVWALVLATYAVFGVPGNFRGGGFIGDAWGMRQKYPEFWRLALKAQPWMFWVTVSIHLAEAWHMDRTRLRKHSVPRLSPLWWKWMGSTFVEGFGNFLRLDAWVEGERRRKEKAAH